MYFRILSFLLTLQLQAQVPNTLIPYCVGEVYGYSDFKGKLIIPPSYTSAGLFNSSGYAIVGDTIVKTKLGYETMSIIDRKGKRLTKGIYEYIQQAISEQNLAAFLEKRVVRKNNYLPFEYDPTYQYELQRIAKKHETPDIFLFSDTAGNSYLFNLKKRKRISKNYPELYFLGIHKNEPIFIYRSFDSTMKIMRSGIVSLSGEELSPAIYQSIYLDSRDSLYLFTIGMAPFDFKRTYENKQEEIFYIDIHKDPNRYWTKRSLLPFDSLFFYKDYASFVARIDGLWAFFRMNNDTFEQISPHKYKYTKGCGCLNESCSKYACITIKTNNWVLVDENDSVLASVDSNYHYDFRFLELLGIISSFDVIHHGSIGDYDYRGIYFIDNNKFIECARTENPSVINNSYYNGKLTGQIIFYIFTDQGSYYVRQDGFKYSK